MPEPVPIIEEFEPNKFKLPHPERNMMNRFYQNNAGRLLQEVARQRGEAGAIDWWINEGFPGWYQPIQSRLYSPPHWWFCYCFKDGGTYLLSGLLCTVERQGDGSFSWTSRIGETRIMNAGNEPSCVLAKEAALRSLAKTLVNIKFWFDPHPADRPKETPKDENTET